MRLVDLNPTFLDNGGAGITDRDGNPVPLREGVGVEFDCPCGCGHPCYVPFDNPLNGGPERADGHPRWHRTGETFDTLTLTPSILRVPGKGGCGWHGWVTNGEIVNA